MTQNFTADVLICGAGGQQTRLFDLFKGPHWTLIGYEVERSAVPARPRLRIHMIGTCGDVVDDGGRFHDAYALSPGEWGLVRYVGAVVASSGIAALESYLQTAGLGLGSGEAS